MSSNLTSVKVTQDDDGSFAYDITRNDGVTFVHRSHSPNGTPVYFLTAHDENWASVPVGRFESPADALKAAETFVMPAHI